MQMPSFMGMRRLGLLAFVVLSCTIQAATIHVTQLSTDTLIQRLQLAPRSNRERHDALQKLFADAGCTTSDQPVPHHDPNIVCTLPGKSDLVLVIGAHYDKVDQGRGVADNWSGAALLPSIYQSLNVAPRQHTIVLIAFSGEEDGLIGSKYYIRQSSKEQLGKTRAMVAIDTLGLGPTEVWAHHSDQTLLSDSVLISRALNLPLTAMNVEQVGDTDSTSFRAAKIPTITFHSITEETLPILHSARDTMASIDQKAYVDSCHLLAAYAAYLDEFLDSATGKAN